MKHYLTVIAACLFGAGCGLVRIQTGTTTSADQRNDKRAELAAYADDIGKVMATLQPKCPETVFDDLLNKYSQNPFIVALRKANFNGSFPPDVMAGPVWKELALDARRARLDEAITNCVVLPKDVYEGPDRAELQKRFEEEGLRLSGKPVVKVVFRNSGWDRKVVSELVDHQIVHYDHAFMNAWVVAKKNESTGEVWEVIGKKDFQDGGKFKWTVRYVPYRVTDIRLAHLADR
jgi:hypothetical protein